MSQPPHFHPSPETKEINKERKEKVLTAFNQASFIFLSLTMDCTEFREHLLSHSGPNTRKEKERWEGRDDLKSMTSHLRTGA